MVGPADKIAYETLVQTIYQKSNFDFVGIALKSADSLEQIKWRYVRGNITQRYRRIVLRNGLGIAGLVLRTGEPFFDNALNDKSQNLMYTPITVVEKLNSAAAIPIIDPQSRAVTGVLMAGYRNGSPVSHETVAILRYYLRRA
ncbi:GAF domain-containing protein [Agrilactobacillus yilanensis]|uniref:GAF domain-containing protein n=1 Tax=Agrilactobacillus yilanensis TaxID=2485997 RepID=A0ABW4J8I5_9LACO|nr:GAF domain-containing protein [Agrilactobacillus yilanensis]